MIRFLPGVLIILAACSPAGKSIRNQDEAPPSADEITAQFSKIPVPQLEVSSELANGWTVSFPTLPDAGKAIVSLPHSASLPDSELMYESELDFPFAGTLMVRADDGAQVFIKGTQIRNEGGTLFQINEPGRVKIRIRVMNNAMSGGLKRVTFSSGDQTKKFFAEQARYKKLNVLAKQAQLPSVSDSTRVLIADALLNFDDSLKRIAAEQSLVNSPLLIGPVIVFQDTSVVRIAVIREGQGKTLLNWGIDSLRLDREITCVQDICSFRIPVAGLEGRTIYYQVRSGNTTKSINAFHVPRSPDRFSFNIWADSQSGWAEFETHMRNSLKYDEAFSVGVGDLVGNGASESEWIRLFEILSISGASKPTFLVPGNHDYDGFYDELIPKNFFKYTQYPKNYFSWRYGNAAFIALDPNERFPIGIPTQSSQYRWLLDELEKESWKNATWRFILVHQPPYSQGWHGYHGEMILRRLLEPLIGKHKIDFIVSGHTHDYERRTMRYGSHDVTYLVVGGGGGGLEPEASSDEPKMDTVIKVHHIARFRVSRNAVSLHVYDLDDRIIDSLMVSKPREL